MSNKNIDILNIGLILISFFLAVYLPFKLFLISYAVLGPLHYLTELNWLHQKDFFVTKKHWSWMAFFIIAALLISIYPLYQLFTFDENEKFKWLETYGSVVIISCFLFSLVLLFYKKNKVLLYGIIAAFLLSIVFYLISSKTSIVLGYFLTTILHVYLFTLLFMVFGVQKSGSFYGWISIALMLIIPLILAIIPINYQSYELAGQTKSIYEKSSFLNLGREIGGLLGILEDGIFYVLSVKGLKIQMFIAFAYTYHYLNWFSKTSIIGWGKALNKQKSLIIGVLWLISVSLYAINYKIGLVSLFFLSFLHVFAEFPLNWKTTIAIFGYQK